MRRAMRQHRTTLGGRVPCMGRHSGSEWGCTVRVNGRVDTNEPSKEFGMDVGRVRDRREGTLCARGRRWGRRSRCVCRRRGWKLPVLPQHRSRRRARSHLRQPRAAVPRDGPRLRIAACEQFRWRQRSLRQSVGRDERCLEQRRVQRDLRHASEAHQPVFAEPAGLGRRRAQADDHRRQRRGRRFAASCWRAVWRRRAGPGASAFSPSGAGRTGRCGVPARAASGRCRTPACTASIRPR